MSPLHTYQRDATRFILNTPRCLLQMPMGSGKSLTTLTALDSLSLLEDVFPALVIAPLRVAQSTWPNEVAQWPFLEHLRVSVVTGSPAQRQLALDKTADIYTTNYENLPWLEAHLHSRWPFRSIVADESTKLKGFRTRQGTKRAKSLAKVAFRSPRFIGLTGTPAPNGLQDLWGQVWFCDQGQRLGKSFTAFQSRWFRSIQMGANAMATKLEPYPHSQKEIEDRIRDITYSLDIRDHLDIRQPIVNIIKVKLPTNAAKLYRQMEQEMWVQLASLKEVEAVNAAAKTQKCLQIASGFAYHDAKRNYEEIHDAKLEALDSVIEEACGAPVLVAYAFKADLERLLKRFPKGKAMDADPKTIEQWNAGKIPVLFVHPKSAGHGLNLQHGGNILCFYGIDWNLEDRLQVIERIGPVRQKQAGYDRPVFIHYLIAEGTVDELVLTRVDAKKSVMETLMQNLKNR
jgi:SNF2 family DNA or RNA helicase